MLCRTSPIMLQLSRLPGGHHQNPIAIQKLPTQPAFWKRHAHSSMCPRSREKLIGMCWEESFLLAVPMMLDQGYYLRIPLAAVIVVPCKSTAHETWARSCRNSGNFPIRDESERLTRSLPLCGEDASLHIPKIPLPIGQLIVLERCPNPSPLRT